MQQKKTNKLTTGEKKTKCKIQNPKKKKMQNKKLPSLSYATSDGRGPHRPNLTGVGDNAR